METIFRSEHDKNEELSQDARDLKDCLTREIEKDQQIAELESEKDEANTEDNEAGEIDINGGELIGTEGIM